MDNLMKVIVMWLSTNFGTPDTHEHPKVMFIANDDMIEVRADVLDHQEDLATLRAAVRQGEGFLSLYDDASRTIYLPEDWSAASPADVSLLVHEYVHHVQNVGHLAHGCEEERERLPYRAQSRWLDLFGTTLEKEFGVDGLTLLVRTKCWQ